MRVEGVKKGRKEEGEKEGEEEVEDREEGGTVEDMREKEVCEDDELDRRKWRGRVGEQRPLTT